MKALKCLLFALGLLGLTTLSCLAHSDEGWTNPRQAGSGSGEARINGDDAQITLNGDSLAAYGVIRSRNLSGDFELTARIRLSTTRPRNGENRRAQLLLDSQEAGRSGRNQVYVGLVQRTAGRLAQTGGELRAITNLVIDGTGGRISTRPLPGDGNSATFRLSRRGGEISTYIAEQGEWVQLNTWSGGFGDTVRVNFQVDNKWETSLPCPASGNVTYLSEASTDNPATPARRPAGRPAGDDSLAAALGGLRELLENGTPSPSASNAVPDPLPIPPAPREEARRRSQETRRADTSPRADERNMRNEPGAAPARRSDNPLDELTAVASALDQLLNPNASRPSPQAEPPREDPPLPREDPGYDRQASPASPDLLPRPVDGRQAEDGRRSADDATAYPNNNYNAARDTDSPAAPDAAGEEDEGTTPAPARLGLRLSDFTEEKWPFRDQSLWAAPARPLPLPAEFPAAASVFAPFNEINLLAPDKYEDLVTTAKSGMHLLMGPLSAADELAFEKRWAPLYEFPCRQTLDYLRRFNPLCAQFLSARTALEEAAKAYDRAQAELLSACSADDPDLVRAATELMRIQKDLIQGHSNTMARAAKAIAKLGPLPSPLEEKGRARRRHDAAMATFEPLPFEGEWIGPDGENKAYRGLQELAPGRWLVYIAPISRMGRAAPGAKWFLRDCLWIMERTGDGRWLLLDWTMVRSVEVFQFQGNKASVLALVPGNSFNPDPSFRRGNARRVKPPQAELPVAGGGSWQELLALARDNAKAKQDQYAKWREKYPNEYEDALNGGPGEASRQIAFKQGREKIREELARRRATDLNQFEGNVSAAKWMAESNGKTYDVAAERARYTRDLDKRQKEDEEAMTENLKIELGMIAPPAPPAEPQQQAMDPAQLAAAQAAQAQAEYDAAVLAERVKLHEANIAYFQSRIEDLGARQASASDADRENLSWQLMVMQSNLQREQDAIVMAKTGEWVRTPTAFDSFVPQQIAEETRQRAALWGQANRVLERAQRQIALAPPEDRDRLLQNFNQSVALAKGDPKRIIHAGKTLFDQVQGDAEALSGKADENLINADRNLAFVQNVKTVSSTSLMVIGTVATAGGGGTLICGQLTAEGLVQGGYQTVTGYLEGGLTEAVKQAAGAYSNAAGLFTTGFDAYQEAVLEHLRAQAENPGDVQLDENGAGLKGVAWALAAEAAKAAAMKFAVEPACVTLRSGLPRPVSTPQIRVAGVRGVNAPGSALARPKADPRTGPGSGVNYEPDRRSDGRYPTIAERITNNQWQRDNAAGRNKVSLFKQRQERVDALREAGAPADQVIRAERQAEDAYKLVKTDWHAKATLKKIQSTSSNPTLVRNYAMRDRRNMGLLMATVNERLTRANLPPQRLHLISNSANEDSVGMDIDMHAGDPPRFITRQTNDTPPRTLEVPNPEYLRWRENLVRNHPDGTRERLSTEQFRREADQALRASVREIYGDNSEQVFPTFTSREHAEAYKDLAWLGNRCTKHALFNEVNPVWSGQAADVTGYKVNSLPRDHPSLPAYLHFQEQARGLTKDMDTKLFGFENNRSGFGDEAGITPTLAHIHPDSPLAKAPDNVKQHFLALRAVLNDFASNRCSPVDADRRLKALTGGRGVPEVADQLAVVLQSR